MPLNDTREGRREGQVVLQHAPELLGTNSILRLAQLETTIRDAVASPRSGGNPWETRPMQKSYLKQRLRSVSRRATERTLT